MAGPRPYAIRLSCQEGRIAFRLAELFTVYRNPSPGHAPVDYAEFNLTGILGEFAASRLLTGSSTSALLSRLSGATIAARRGRPNDDGTDLEGMNVDVKTSRNRTSHDWRFLRLIVRPEHFQPTRRYVFAVVRDPEDGRPFVAPRSWTVDVIGWAFGSRLSPQLVGTPPVQAYTARTVDLCDMAGWPERIAEAA